MNKTDQPVIIIMLLLIVLDLAAWIGGYVCGRLPRFTAIVNGLTGLAIIGYWGTRQLQIQQHYIEFKEMVVLGLELLVVFLAVYQPANGIKVKWHTIMQYAVFGIHLVVLVLGLLFMLTFRMERMI